MKDYTIAIRCEEYLAQWARCHFGDPVQFPQASIENKLIRRLLQRECGNPAMEFEGNLRICIPSSKEKDPRCGWCFVGRKGKLAIKESLATLFEMNLWAELGDLNKVHCELTTLIYAWMEKHGIDPEFWETIRQKYYRLRKTYARVDITVGHR